MFLNFIFLAAFRNVMASTRRSEKGATESLSAEQINLQKRDGRMLVQAYLNAPFEPVECKSRPMWIWPIGIVHVEANHASDPFVGLLQSGAAGKKTLTRGARQ